MLNDDRPTKPHRFDIFYRKVVDGHVYEFMQGYEFLSVVTARERHREMIQNQGVWGYGAHDIEVSPISGPEIVREVRDDEVFRKGIQMVRDAMANAHGPLARSFPKATRVLAPAGNSEDYTQTDEYQKDPVF